MIIEFSYCLCSLSTLSALKQLAQLALLLALMAVAFAFLRPIQLESGRTPIQRVMRFQTGQTEIELALDSVRLILLLSFMLSNVCKNLKKAGHIYYYTN